MVLVRGELACMFFVLKKFKKVASYFSTGKNGKWPIKPRKIDNFAATQIYGEPLVLAQEVK